jgi:hypothetical protein
MTSLSFFDADLHSISINQATLLEFENLSGPKANPSKSSLFCSGVSSRMKTILLDRLQMKEGQLPVRHLGVPLISTKLSTANYKMLIEKITITIFYTL